MHVRGSRRGRGVTIREADMDGRWFVEDIQVRCTYWFSTRRRTEAMEQGTKTESAVLVATRTMYLVVGIMEVGMIMYKDEG